MPDAAPVTTQVCRQNRLERRCIHTQILKTRKLAGHHVVMAQQFDLIDRHRRVRTEIQHFGQQERQFENGGLCGGRLSKVVPRWRNW
jgi:hypothetical protein